MGVTYTIAHLLPQAQLAPPGGSVNERRRRYLEQLLADERPVRAVAARVRAAPDASRLAALSDPHIADCCAEDLDALADELVAMPTQVRDHTVRVPGVSRGRDGHAHAAAPDEGRTRN